MMKEVTILTFDETETLRQKLGCMIDTLNDIDNEYTSSEHIICVIDELKEIKEMFS